MACLERARPALFCGCEEEERGLGKRQKQRKRANGIGGVGGGVLVFI